MVTDLVRRTAIQGPTVIVFDWRAQDRDFRGNGRGVARLEGPNRARLDLYASNNETVLVAALVGNELRIPPGVEDGIVPPPDLLWAVLGIFHQSRDLAVLGGSESEDGAVEMRLRTADGDEYRVRSAGGRLTRMDRFEGGSAIEEVVLTHDGSGRFPQSARYRHLGGFRELTVNRVSEETVETFPLDIWNPGGTGGR